MTKLTYIVGVDCGESTGLGVYHRVERRLMHWCTTDFFGCPELLSKWFAGRFDQTRVFVEVPKPFIYARNRKKRKKEQFAYVGSLNLPIEKLEEEKEEPWSEEVRDRHAINVGGVIRESKLQAEQLRRTGFEVREVEPVPQKKWDAKVFNVRFNTTKRTNQHERDACRLAYVYA